MGRCRAIVLAMGLLCGCAATSQGSHLAAMPESMCKHCNCLMPAGVDPQATCPACNCGKRAHQCVR